MSEAKSQNQSDSCRLQFLRCIGASGNFNEDLPNSDQTLVLCHFSSHIICVLVSESDLSSELEQLSEGLTEEGRLCR